MNDSTQTVFYPDVLMRWAGHHEGGVRRPFQANSGRPAGLQFETSLTSRLNKWVEDLVCGKQVPRSIFLVGGPGNGKTDAIEGCIEKLDGSLGARGLIRDQFAKAFSPEPGNLSPRKVVVDMSKGADLPAHLRVSFSLVQDATEGNPSERASAEELLFRELGEIATGATNDIYLCCVNRGILAKASALAHGDSSQASAGFLDQITRAVTSSPDSPRCWPLEGFSQAAVWPMDMESLVEPSGENGKSVAHQILETILAPDRWKPVCALNSRCPFCQNRVLLSRKIAGDSLVKMLHYYELLSGKRWTFRDLYSLFSYLLVGDYDEFITKGKPLSPCEWASEQWRLCENGTPGSAERDRAVFLLASKLYHHRLFPRWPSLDAGQHRNAKQELFKGRTLENGLNAARGFFRFMAKADELTSRSRGEVPDRLRKSFCKALDPAASTGKHVLFEREGASPTTVEDLEETFSLSIRAGIQLIGSHVPSLEKDVLEHLAKADEALSEEGFQGNHAHHARLLGTAIRQYAVRFVKRSLGTRRGICRDEEHFRNYASAMAEGAGLNETRTRLRRLLHDQHDKFRAPLATTFGQPVAERSRDVMLVMGTVSVMPVQRPPEPGRPRDPIRYFKVQGYPVPVTFELFRALQEVESGRHSASLPAEIYGLLDRTRSLVAGLLVRDADLLANGPKIVFGSSEDSVEYVNGKFHFTGRATG